MPDAPTAEDARRKEFTHRREGKTLVPLAVFAVNDRFRLAVYQGQISPHDIRIKYKQKSPNGTWSRLRTPKHIHWAADVMIKLNEDRAQTQAFLEFLIRLWNRTQGWQSAEERHRALDMEQLLADCRSELAQFEALSARGEYSLRFLVLLAKLLMLQEKTNRPDAHAFGNLLEELWQGKDIFRIVSAATMRGR